VGEPLGVSEPELVDQATVDQHAETTGDAQWIHNDPERARREGPFGGPIVQGFLLLSMLTAHVGNDALASLGRVSMGINYGFERVRFHAPVPVGDAVRMRSTLAEVRPKPDGSAVIGIDVVVEVVDSEGGEPTPAVAARWLFLAVP
jgi:acyl dehydratase